MSQVTVKWSGLQELREALRNMTATLRAEASQIIEAHADEAAGDVKAAYKGKFQGDVKVEKRRNQSGTVVIVKNKSKHALPYEEGSQVRHTSGGANRGAAPQAHVFNPITRRVRRKMNRALKEMVVKHGFLVSGDDA